MINLQEVRPDSTADSWRKGGGTLAFKGTTSSRHRAAWTFPEDDVCCDPPAPPNLPYAKERVRAVVAMVTENVTSWPTGTGRDETAYLLSKELRKLPMADFREDPTDATGPAGEMEASLVESLLTELVHAPSRRINSLFLQLAGRPQPKLLLQVAVWSYSETGRQAYLDHAAALMEYMGARAWPALESLARSLRPECDSFVHVIAHCEGVSEANRRDALLNLAKNPSLEVRAQLFESMSDLSRDVRLALLNALANDVDEEIQEEARERLESLA